MSTNPKIESVDERFKINPLMVLSDKLLKRGILPQETAEICLIVEKLLTTQNQSLVDEIENIIQGRIDELGQGGMNLAINPSQQDLAKIERRAELKRILALLSEYKNEK